MTSLAGRRHSPAHVTDRGRLALDLTRAVRGEVRFDRGSQALYASDAAVCRQVPIGVVVPRDADDVISLAVCRKHEVPVLARSFGTRLEGQSVKAASQDHRSRPCRDQLAEALSWNGPAIIECVTDQHDPPYPAKVRRDQAAQLMAALREDTPNRRIALQMVKDLLDESSFDASPAHAIPGPVGRDTAKIAGKLQDNDHSNP